MDRKNSSISGSISPIKRQKSTRQLPLQHGSRNRTDRESLNHNLDDITLTFFGDASMKRTNRRRRLEHDTGPVMDYSPEPDLDTNESGHRVKEDAGLGVEELKALRERLGVRHLVLGWTASTCQLDRFSLLTCLLDELDRHIAVLEAGGLSGPLQEISRIWCRGVQATATEKGFKKAIAAYEAIKSKRGGSFGSRPCPGNSVGRNAITTASIKSPMARAVESMLAAVLKPSLPRPSIKRNATSGTPSERHAGKQGNDGSKDVSPPIASSNKPIRSSTRSFF